MSTELQEFLKEFSDELRNVLNQCGDGDDFNYLVDECIDLNKGTLSCFQPAEIKRAIRLAVSGSYSHLIEGDKVRMRKVIWGMMEHKKKEEA